MSASSKKKLRKEQEAAQLTEKQQREKKDAKKLRNSTIAFILVMAIVLGIFAYAMISRAVERSGLPQRLSTALEVGEHKLSSAELSYFYIDAISEYYNDYYEQFGSYTGSFLLMMGLDVAQPLDEQYMDTENKVTWGEYFANMGAEKAKQVYALVDAANAAGFTLTQENLDSIESELLLIEAYAPLYGYDSLKDYLKGTYGYGSTEKSFRQYLEDTALARLYYNKYTEDLVYTDEDYREHEKEHYNEYSNFTFYSYTMNVNAFYEGGTTNEDNTITYTEEEKEAGRKTAAEAAETIKNCGATTNEELDKAIAALPAYADNENAKTTLADNVSYDKVSTEILDWICEDGRKAGDLGVLPITSTTTNENGEEVTTTTGYYVVLFQEREDNNMNLVDVRHILVEFEGGTEDDSGNIVYSDEEKLNAKTAAEKILEQFNGTAKTEDDFAALVKDNSDDPGSVDNGGLYEKVYPGQMRDNFDAWCFDENRKAGDCEIVETELGYHIIYFVGENEVTFRDYMIDNVLRSEDAVQWLDDLVQAVNVGKLNISKLELDYVMSPSTAY